VACAILVHGWWLAAAFAAAGAAALLLARAVSEPRFQLLGLAYATGTAVVALWHAPPRHLLAASEHPAGGIAGLLALVALLALGSVVANAAPVADELDRLYARVLPRLRRVLTWSGGGVVLYGVSLLVLELCQRLGGSLHTGFQRGETAVSALWAAAGLALLCVGLFRRRRPVRVGGLVLLGVALVKLFLFDLAYLSSMSRALSFLVVGAALLGGGVVYQKLNAELGHGVPTT
jgi:uncharacterized membrane protein